MPDRGLRLAAGDGRMGHEDAFPRPRLNARYRFSQGTLARKQDNGRDAPKAVVPASVNGRQGSTRTGPSRDREDFGRFVTPKHVYPEARSTYRTRGFQGKLGRRTERFG
jgi:hypothetical protein